LKFVNKILLTVAYVYLFVVIIRQKCSEGVPLPYTCPMPCAVCWLTTSLRQWLAASLYIGWTTATPSCLVRQPQHMTYC